MLPVTRHNEDGFKATCLYSCRYIKSDGRRFFVVVFLQSQEEVSFFLCPAKIPSNFLITAASNSMTFYGNDNNLG